jgi:hypothetical protein
VPLLPGDEFGEDDDCWGFRRCCRGAAKAATPAIPRGEAQLSQSVATPIKAIATPPSRIAIAVRESRIILVLFYLPQNENRRSINQSINSFVLFLLLFCTHHERFLMFYFF